MLNTLEEYDGEVENYLNQSYGVCMDGVCKGCHLKAVCNQPCPFFDGHEEEMIEALCMKFRRCITELKNHMQLKGYKNLEEIRGANHRAWLDFLN